MPGTILGCHKNRLAGIGVQPAALAARSIGVMQQAALAVFIIFK